VTDETVPLEEPLIFLAWKFTAGSAGVKTIFLDAAVVQLAGEG